MAALTDVILLIIIQSSNLTWLKCDKSIQKKQFDVYRITENIELRRQKKLKLWYIFSVFFRHIRQKSGNFGILEL